MSSKLLIASNAVLALGLGIAAYHIASLQTQIEQLTQRVVELQQVENVSTVEQRIEQLSSQLGDVSLLIEQELQMVDEEVSRHEERLRQVASSVARTQKAFTIAQPDIAYHYLNVEAEPMLNRLADEVWRAPEKTDEPKGENMPDDGHEYWQLLTSAYQNDISPSRRAYFWTLLCDLVQRRVATWTDEHTFVARECESRNRTGTANAATSTAQQ